MGPFEYRRATDSGNAFVLLREPADRSSADARVLAGGTDLIPLMKDGVIQPRRVVDIKRMTDIGRGIRVTDQGVVVGALATLADLESNPAVDEHCPALGEAVRSAATPQLRAMATLGGNLLQRPRCWYFRNPDFHCWLAGGSTCHAREGRNDRHAIFPATTASPCCAVHPSDLAPCLVALDAEVLLRSPGGGERLLAVEHLFQPPTPERRTETVLDGELLVEVRLPHLPLGARTGYRKAMDRAAWSFALSSVAARLDIENDRISDARVVLGGVANVPWRAPDAEAVLRGSPPSDQLFDRAATLALAGAEPLRHNGYKVPLTRGLVAEALRALI
jgi:xanthine dehydrogenase YagS FAD-binding subunit